MNEWARLRSQLSIETRLLIRDRTLFVFQVALPILLLLGVGTLHGQLGARQWSVLVVDDHIGGVAKLEERLRRIPGVTFFRSSEGKVPSLAHASAVIAPASSGEADDAVIVCGRSQLAAVAKLIANVADQPERCAAYGLSANDERGPLMLLAGAVAMALSGMGLFGFGARLAAYRQRGLLRVLAHTPNGSSRLLVIQAIHRVGFATLQSLVLVAVGRYGLGLQGPANWVGLTAVIVAGGMAFTAIGFVLGGVVSSAEVATGIGHLMNFPALVLSGAFYPRSMLPPALDAIGAVSPMTQLVQGIGNALSGEDAGLLQVFGLIAVAFVASVIGIRTFRFE